jgi:hypothetical protein
LVLAIAAAAAAGAIVLLSRGAPPGPGRAVPSSPPAGAPLAMTAPAPLAAASAAPAASPEPDPLASLPPEDAEWVLDLVGRAEQVRALDPEERRELIAQLVSVRTHAVLERTEPLATPPEGAP